MLLLFFLCLMECWARFLRSWSPSDKLRVRAIAAVVSSFSPSAWGLAASSTVVDSETCSQLAYFVEVFGYDPEVVV